VASPLSLAELAKRLKKEKVRNDTKKGQVSAHQAKPMIFLHPIFKNLNFPFKGLFDYICPSAFSL
jgi:hypothetical protein